MDTIVALATAQGRAGVAIIRASGDQAFDLCEAIAGFVPAEREVRWARFRDATGSVIDTGLVLAFEQGRSFTGERVCEFQVHGSVAVAGAMLRACLAVEGVRAAEAGEFTRRAFLNGRMDLTEVEALADLIDAETDAQRRQALSVMDGSARAMVEGWREDLLQSLAMMEAALDFADEELPDDLTEHVVSPLRSVQGSLQRQLAGRRASESVRSGFEVAIIGRVNAGKSTLLNALAGRDAAITSSRAGTTRDVIEVRMELDGLAVTLIDTAGLRESDDEIEQTGIERGQSRAARADLRVFLQSSPDEEPVNVVDGDIVALSKADLWGIEGLSAQNGQGISDLVGRITDELRDRAQDSSVFTRERHFDKLTRAQERIDAALDALGRGVDWDLVSEDVKAGIRALDGIIGRVDVEDVLGRIFASFCIGK
ncbi:tRNA uridine-5-carboxymethylaminomethyl(34) synthesis GTPase MnmE [Rhodobacter sp. NTK016B]|uniref:tRNA uridine-5-carboxymethylaminomethyl(34) synthesis GTPase MnmE n=1 Tax=Rhodobacter sp. NTK016B TaxID=2759676 RepID=UPI001A8DCE64|nr:tRNA uridine-5-carboxymethylaminomethyl(34) synthesis GTPase MnmE [Rhodobacter sp. NTK016B]MBN8292224.1 tRNA uridine-5-carboxymethylaminomethyl(34) synthesis GTPase MnmE [Rhodobacter sp. NTK016B]